MAHFTHYWTPEGPGTFSPGAPIENASGGGFLKSGVRSGDTIYVVSIRNGALLLWGRFEVDLITEDRAEAVALLGHDPWDAPEHVVGRRGSGVPYDPDREVPLAVTQQLRFLTATGPKGLTFRSAGALDGQTLRGIRKPVEESIALLDSLLLPSGVPTRSAKTIEIEFDRKLKEARRDQAARRERLKKASRRPETVTAIVSVFIRSADVVAEVLDRASGHCELCGKPAPFTRRSDGSPYLEVHHRVQLSAGGDDSVENGLALCPNCHRQQHYG